MDAPQKHERSEMVYGWKGISAVLGCAPNTARKYAKKHGLPVEKKGGRYQARKGALLAWLDDWEKRPKDGRLRSRAPQGSDPGQAGRGRGRWFLAAGLVVVVAALWFVRGRDHGDIATVSLEHRVLSGFDDAGRKLWMIPLPEILDQPVLAGTHYLIKDVDGDARRELVFIERKQRKREKTSRLVCFDEDGEQLWDFEYGHELRVGERRFARTFEGFRVDWVEAGDRAYLLTVGHQTPWYPSQVVLLEPSTGKVLAEYLHPGQLKDFALVNLDADGQEEILLGGINNPGPGFGRPVLVALDLPFPGRGVEESFFGSLSGRELAYLVLPEIDVCRARGHGAAAHSVDLRPDGRILATVGLEAGMRLHYYFSAKLELLGVFPADGFVQEHDRLFRQADLDHPLDQERELEHWSEILRFATAPDANRLPGPEAPPGGDSSTVAGR